MKDHGLIGLVIQGLQFHLSQISFGITHNKLVNLRLLTLWEVGLVLDLDAFRSLCQEGPTNQPTNQPTKN
jgi:hypothetical protein